MKAGTINVSHFADEKPKVECSLVTEFQDHIFVAVDAENFFFLHDLISSYVKDTKEKMVSCTVAVCITMKWYTNVIYVYLLLFLSLLILSCLYKVI